MTATLILAPSARLAALDDRITLSKAEAAAALGISVDSFERYVMPYLRCIRRGRMRLYVVSDLRAWADENAEPLLDAA